MTDIDSKSKRSIIISRISGKETNLEIIVHNYLFLNLTSYYNELKTKNTNVVTETVSLSNARIARNDILYNEITSLLDVATDVKTYIKSVFGARSPLHQQVSWLKFANPR